MNEKGKALTYASQIIGGDIQISRAEFESLQQRIVDALTTVRKEARGAAFGDALRAINNMEVVITRFQSRSADMNGWYSAIKQAHAAIKAAANTEEGGGDG